MSPLACFSSSGLRVQQLTEDCVVQLAVFRLGQLAAQGLVVLLDRFHGVLDGLGAVVGVGQLHQVVELGLGSEVDRSLLCEVCLLERRPPAAPGGQARLDLVLHGEEAAVGVA